jgi:transcriptional regulator with XRE-family HTH domain
MSVSSKDSASALIKIFQSLRAAKGLTLEDAAELAGIHRTHLGLIEKGQRQPTLQVAMQLAEAFDYRLSDLLVRAELIASGDLDEETAFEETHARIEHPEYIRNPQHLAAITGLTPKMLLDAIHRCYNTLDTIDKELISKKEPSVAHLFELANLSSMVGNLLGASIAEVSNGLYSRNNSHKYPDLLLQGKRDEGLEIKMALDTNRPKGHLPKPGAYITFRYVLCDSKGTFNRGKKNRGDTVWIWEVRVGSLGLADFAPSDTKGDSGKTAPIKKDVFEAMRVVYSDPIRCPYVSRNGSYPGLN